MTNELKRAIARRDQIQALTLSLVESDPWVPITLGGQSLKLEYSYDAVVEVFRTTGLVLNLTEIRMEHVGNPAVFGPLLAAGLRTHHAGLLNSLELQEKLVTSLVPMRHLKYVQTCIALALQVTEPSAEDIDRILAETEREFPSEEAQQQLPLEAAPSSDDSGQGA